MKTCDEQGRAHAPPIRPTWFELEDARGDWAGDGMWEDLYCNLYPRWPELLRAGMIRRHGGRIKLARRGWKEYSRMAYQRFEAMDRVQERRRAQRRHSR